MQFYKVKCRKNGFCKHAEDLCAILKHVGAKMQFYKENNAEKCSVHANGGPKCKNEEIQGKNAMQQAKDKNK